MDIFPRPDQLEDFFRYCYYHSLESMGWYFFVGLLWVTLLILKQHYDSEYVIIESGLTGLTIADVLQTHGFDVVVVDKGPKAGGRMAHGSFS